MPASVIGIDEPDSADKNLSTWQRTIGATSVQEQVLLPGEAYQATYSALATGISTAASASHLIALEADGTNYVRIRRIYISQAALAGAAATAQLQVVRTTTASSAGTSVTARAFDEADSAYGGAIRTLPTKGTEGSILLQSRLGLTAAQPVTSVYAWEWRASDAEKPIIIAPANTNGIALKIVTGIASATCDVTIEFTTTTYL
jgi:hypothetical protein